MINKHPGFKAVQAKVMKQGGYSKEAAGAIVASAARKASSKAKKANPRLKRVKDSMNKTITLDKHEIVIDIDFYEELLRKAIAFNRMMVVGSNFKIEIPNISNMYPDLLEKSKEELIEEYKGK